MAELEKEEDLQVLSEKRISEDFLKKVQEVGYAAALKEVSLSRAKGSNEQREVVRKMILSGTFTSTKAQETTFKQTFNEAYQALTKESKDIDKIYTELEDYDEAEKAIINRAEKRIKDADKGIRDAEQALATANAVPNTWWNRFWNNREKAVVAAQENVAVAIVEKQAATDNLPIVKKEVDSMQEVRVMNSSIEDTQNAFIKRSKAVTAALRVEHKKNIDDATALKTAHDKLQTDFMDKASKLEPAFNRRKEAQEKLDAAIQEKNETSPGTKEASELDKKVGDLQKELNEASNAYSELLAVHNEYERFSPIMLGEITTLEQTAGEIMAKVKEMEAATEARELTLPAVVRVIQAMRVQDVASKNANVGKATDRKGFQIVAMALQAFLQNTQADLFKHPEEMKSLIDIWKTIGKIGKLHSEALDADAQLRKEGYNETPLEGPSQNGKVN